MESMRGLPTPEGIKARKMTELCLPCAATGYLFQHPFFLPTHLHTDGLSGHQLCGVCGHANRALEGAGTIRVAHPRGPIFVSFIQSNPYPSPLPRFGKGDPCPLSTPFLPQSLNPNRISAIGVRFHPFIFWTVPTVGLLVRLLPI